MIIIFVYSWSVLFFGQELVHYYCCCLPDKPHLVKPCTSGPGFAACTQDPSSRTGAPVRRWRPQTTPEISSWRLDCSSGSGYSRRSLRPSTCGRATAANEWAEVEEIGKHLFCGSSEITCRLDVVDWTALTKWTSDTESLYLYMGEENGNGIKFLEFFLTCRDYYPSDIKTSTEGIKMLFNRNGTNDLKKFGFKGNSICSRILVSPFLAIYSSRKASL